MLQTEEGIAVECRKTRVWSGTHGAWRKSKGLGVTVEARLHQRCWLHVSSRLYSLVIRVRASSNDEGTGHFTSSTLKKASGLKVESWRLSGIYPLYARRIKRCSYDMPYPEEGIAFEHRKPKRKFFLNTLQITNGRKHAKRTRATVYISVLQSKRRNAVI